MQVAPHPLFPEFFWDRVRVSLDKKGDLSFKGVSRERKGISFPGGYH